jgi:GNAT superfamily N-acetyltransferase
MESARPAVAADAARIGELWRMAQAELAAERGGLVFLAREAADGPALEGPGDGDGRRVWVGTVDGFVLGYLVARTESLHDGQTLGIIDEVFVEPEGRGVGVGEAMIDIALAWLHDQGCIGVDAYALPGTRQTKNFFETFGFTTRLLVVHHRLEQQ